MYVTAHKPHRLVYYISESVAKSFASINSLLSAESGLHSDSNKYRSKPPNPALFVNQVSEMHLVFTTVVQHSLPLSVPDIDILSISVPFEHYHKAEFMQGHKLT